MNLKKIATLGFCLLLASCAHTNYPEDSYDAVDNSQAKAMAAQSPEEIYQLGNHYAKGVGGVSRDDHQAFIYYSEAARRGSAKAQYALGYMYRSGRGVARNYNTAAEWFERSAEQGNADAQNSLGVRYLLGQGTAQDYTQALTWFQKAAAQNNAYAQNELGYMYAAGKGVTRDYPTS
jgi:TPR repeat protein